MIAEFFVFVITFLIVYFFYLHKLATDFFRKCDVKFVPCWPVFGNAYHSTLMKRHIFEDLDAVYKAFPDEKYVGFIEATQPIIMVRDPELIKTLTVKDFDHFVDHKQIFPEDIEPLFGGSVFMMQGA